MNSERAERSARVVDADRTHAAALLQAYLDRKLVLPEVKQLPDARASLKSIFSVLSDRESFVLRQLFGLDSGSYKTIPEIAQKNQT